MSDAKTTTRTARKPRPPAPTTLSLDARLREVERRLEAITANHEGAFFPRGEGASDSRGLSGAASPSGAGEDLATHVSDRPISNPASLAILAPPQLPPERRAKIESALAYALHVRESSGGKVDGHVTVGFGTTHDYEGRSKPYEMIRVQVMVEDDAEASARVLGGLSAFHVRNKITQGNVHFNGRGPDGLEVCGCTDPARWMLIAKAMGLPAAPIEAAPVAPAVAAPKPTEPPCAVCGQPCGVACFLRQRLFGKVVDVCSQTCQSRYDGQSKAATAEDLLADDR